MKAARIHRFGGPEEFRWEETPLPQWNADQVLIKIEAAGLNPVDAKIRAGEFTRFQPSLPAILGRDVSGTIEEVGTSVTNFKKGDRVFGLLDYDRGTYAEYALASTREIAHLPSTIGWPEGGAAPVAALTAWEALFDQGRLECGQRVLIHGASGGVGHFAIQFAKWRGAEVIATCPKEGVDFVKSLGAAIVLDYERQRVEEKVSGLDLVLDLVDGDARRNSWPLLKSRGILVSTLPGPKPDDRTDISGREVVVSVNSSQLITIAQLIEQRAVTPFIHKRFPMTETAAAHSSLQNEHVRGKIVLVRSSA